MLALPEPRPSPHNPAGATCDFPFFNPVEGEFEKVVFSKNVALAIFYHLVFEKNKKVNFSAFYGGFRSVAAHNDLVGAHNFRGRIFNVYFFYFEFFSMDFRYSKVVKTNGEINPLRSKIILQCLLFVCLGFVMSSICFSRVSYV